MPNLREDDHIVNGTPRIGPNGARPLAPFTAQRIDYSLARLAHYTATSPTHSRTTVLYRTTSSTWTSSSTTPTAPWIDPNSGYEMLVSPGNVLRTRDGATGEPQNPPQCPAST